jgi:hypothetical protein
MLFADDFFEDNFLDFSDDLKDLHILQMNLISDDFLTDDLANFCK